MVRKKHYEINWASNKKLIITKTFKKTHKIKRIIVKDRL